VTPQVRASQFQERFLAILGHDLRNPLAAIDMAATLAAQLAAKSGDAAIARATARIGSSSRRMSRMIEQILDLTRSRTGGGFKIHRAPTSLHAMLATIVDEARVAHPKRSIELRCTSSLSGNWDRDRLEQVFSNLIGNAIAHGSTTGPVTVEAHDRGAVIDVDVHNQGPPIPPDQQHGLFDPFRRGDRASRTRATAGLGLGLYISRELVAAHGGTLAVSSSDDTAGTTFRVTLPKAGE
jgi:phosphoserine phosphatase RsbU/P